MGKRLAEPDDAGAQERFTALRAVGQRCGGDGREGVVGVGDVEATDQGIGVGVGFRGCGCWVLAALRDSEGGHDGVGGVVGFFVATFPICALEVEEVAVEQLEFRRWVVGALGQTIDILGEGEEVGGGFC